MAAHRREGVTDERPQREEERAAAISFLTELVGINSVNGPGAERGVVERVAAEAGKLGLAVKELAKPGHEARPNLLVSLEQPQPEDRQATQPPPFLFLFVAHADTVAVGVRSRWSHDPLGGSGIIDGRLHGRGACDNKGGLVAALYTLKRLQRVRDRISKHGTVALAMVADEESGADSPIGLRYLLDQGALRARPSAQVAGGAIYTYPNWTVTIGHRGVVRMRIAVHGEAVHTGSSDWSRRVKGHNAVGALCTMVSRIEAEPWPRVQHPAFPFLPVTVTPGTLISGGSGESIVPASASCSIDIRLPPEQSTRESLPPRERALVEESGPPDPGPPLKEIVVNRINEIISNVIAERPRPDLVNATATMHVDIPPYVLPGGKDHPLAQACAAAVEHVTGAAPPAVRGAGPANEGWMLHAAGIPVICGFGPLGGGFHAADEWVEVGESFSQTMDMYERVVMDALREAEEAAAL